MKKIVFILIILLIWQPNLSGQVFGVEKLLDNGSSDKRINFVYLGDGYTQFQQDDFIIDTQNVINNQFNFSPYKEYKNFFNAYAVKVESVESGVDHPVIAGNSACNPVPEMDKNTFFDSTFDYFDIHRLLVPTAYAKIASVLADNTPFYDQANILVNTPYYGGSGGIYATASTHTDASLIMIHEIGHSFVDLADEYWAGVAYASEKSNMTQESNTAQVKWKNWLGSEGVGIYPYGTSSPESDWFRPHQSCMMRALSNPFCAVCREATIDRIYTLLTPIESFTPSTNMVAFEGTDIDFSIDLILPNPNTLEIEWFLDEVSFATDVTNIVLTNSEITDLTHSVKVQVEDTTDLARTYVFANGYLFTLSWTVNNTSGIEDNLVQKFLFKAYPNPTKEVLNFDYTAQNINEIFKLRITDLQGKVLTTQSFTPKEGVHNLTIPVHAFSSGIYVLTISTATYSKSFKFIKE